MTPVNMLVIVPTRGRPEALDAVMQAVNATRNDATQTHVAFVVDMDDPARDDYYQHGDQFTAWDGIYHSGATAPGMVAALNDAATFHLGSYDVIGFMGDDHRPRTPGWDARIADALASTPGVAYGNDLLQGPNLPTAAFITADLIRRLGYMAPPPLTHLYVDNFWLDLGHATNLTYLPDVVIEHMHPVAGKAAMDDRYEAVNSGAMYDRDQGAYEQFMAEQWPTDRAKLGV